MKSIYKKNLGFTLIEILVVISIIAIMASIAMYNLSAKRDMQALNNDNEQVIALLNEARSRTVSGDQNMQYGVHVQANKVVLFQGAIFSDGVSTNREVLFDSNNHAESISLEGGVSDIIFKKMTGETDGYGTFLLKNASGSSWKTITISKVGLASGE